MRIPLSDIARRATAAGLLIGLSPVIAAGGGLAAADGGPALFQQTRVGLHRTPFVVWKLRTMRDGAITPAGRLLRKTKLDELPQLVNVLRGEMAFVGPRPITAADVERLGWEGAACDERWSVRPGITGPTQLALGCDARRALARDIAYAQQRSLRLDARIAIQTLLRPLLGAKSTTLSGPLWG